MLKLSLNSLTAAKLFRPEPPPHLLGWLLASKTHSSQSPPPIMMSRFPLQWHGFDGKHPPPPEPLQKDLVRPPLMGLVLNYMLNKSLIYFYSLYIDETNYSPAVNNCGQNGIHCHWQATIL
jgi:hypothetical protein